MKLDFRTEGQACTCLLSETALDSADPLLVAPCDSSMIYDEDIFADFTSTGTDCIAFTFRDHPHANRNPQQYGWVTTGPGNLIQRVSCKAAPAGDVRAAHGITGMFWFREARLMYRAIRQLMAANHRINNEFYLDSALQYLVDQGLRVRALDVKHYICYGTPDDVRTFEYWDAYFRKNARHPWGKEAYDGRTSSQTIDRASVL
jgi:bifunctional N-acetylglucosamine-1-phosphate-uridyltransferase/glucosamine-1-phosphate-acetyltransferase GlmU-like protein